MTSAPRIWVIDDEPEVRRVFGKTLATAGFLVITLGDGSEALELLKSEQPALIVLDVSMPRIDGWETLRQIRRSGCKMPVIMITAVNDLQSRVRGLDDGADDYLGKPCSPSELLARVRALLRRASPREGSPLGRLRFGDITIDLDARVSTRAGTPFRLTRTDYLLLRILCERPGKPVSRETILKRIWHGQMSAAHALDTHLWRLRKKLGDTGEEPQFVRNVPCIGLLVAADSVVQD